MLFSDYLISIWEKKNMVGRCHIQTSQILDKTESWNTDVTITRQSQEVNENIPDTETKTDMSQNTQRQVRIPESFQTQ